MASAVTATVKRNQTTNSDKVLISFSKCLTPALLKNTNASSVIYRHLTAMKVVDYCLESLSGFAEWANWTELDGNYDPVDRQER